MPPRSRSDLAPLLALLAMTAAWGSTFFLIKDLLTEIPVLDFLSIRFLLAAAVLLAAAPRSLLRLSPAELRQGVGLGVLSLDGFAIGYGELLTVLSALVYAGHIIAMGRWSTPGEALPLSLVQMVVITAVCAVGAAWPGSGSPGLQLPVTTADWLAVLYLAVVAGALTMVLQTWAQARVEASRAAVVMAMEPVWAAAFAVTLGDDRLTFRIVAGGLAILAAMYLVELAPRRRTGSSGEPAAAPALEPGREFP